MSLFALGRLCFAFILTRPAPSIFFHSVSRRPEMSFHVKKFKFKHYLFNFDYTETSKNL